MCRRRRPINSRLGAAGASTAVADLRTAGIARQLDALGRVLDAMPDDAGPYVGRRRRRPTKVTYRLEPHDGATRFTFEHTGFTGLGSFLLAKLVMTPIRKKMFGVRVPALLDDDAGDGKRRS